ncbi:hypothetical protein WR25_03456 [Diploscapter pachys]|uniref:Vesicle-fusing ATPase n=1 Tax=Diploscapter pachys TaxID=2018661 RepID=A0A2A2J753_9BILA|nr:hypothetical protein WR25_03456 [Diploscapter pachys]
MKVMRARKCPTDALALTNCAVVSRNDFDEKGVRHVRVNTGPAHHFIFSIRNHPEVKPGEIAFAMPQRKWAALSLDQELQVNPFSFPPRDYMISVTLSVDFQLKKNATSEPLNSDAMAREFGMQFVGNALTKGMQMVFQFTDPEKGKTHNLSLAVKSIEAIDMNAAAGGQSENSKPYAIEFGQLQSNTGVIFDKEEGSTINLIGKSKGKLAYRAIINPDWDFQKMGIGGLDKEFSGIFRRAFASRVFPPEFIEQLAMKHVRGILLFGPPGTGKTLMARQIGKMLNAREPKIVNGPQILDKYVGESEANIRKLFADAEEEWKRCGANSGLHIIIFDEIDAICKQRGSMAGSSSVHDTVVNQLLSKMDGVDQLNNILVIGMTNRKDMIDEALLRPGRLEVQMEVSLPDEPGRLQILKIHTARMREYKKLDQDVNLEDLAKRTKNFSGAELEGLVRAAQSSAMNRLVKAGGKVQLDPDAIEKLMVNSEDFNYALENDIKPAFGRSDESLNKFLDGELLIYGSEVQKILEYGDLLVTQAKNPQSRTGLVRAVLAGAPQSGVSRLAAEIARRSDFPFVRVVSNGDMVGFSETAKCAALRKAFDDAKRSKMSVLLIDDVEQLVDYTPVGPRFSNLVLKALVVLLKEPVPKDHRLLILATSSDRAFLREFGLLNAFGHLIDVPQLTKWEHVMNVVTEADTFSREEIQKLRYQLEQLFDKNLHFGIGIKRLLDLIDLSRQCDEGYRGTELFERLEMLALSL